MNRTASQIVGACFCFALLTSLVASPAAAQSDEERFLVEVDAEGDAVVSVTFAYDLDSGDEEAAFEELQENTTAQATAGERFENRLATVAADTSATVDREMSVRNASVELHRDGDVGIVTLSVEWSNLAAVDGDRLTVTEPFASGFEPDRSFTLVVPDGHVITSTSPEPERVDETSATWNADATLETFEVVAEAQSVDSSGGMNDSETREETPDSENVDDSPGFGVIVAVVALSIGSLFARRRRR